MPTWAVDTLPSQRVPKRSFSYGIEGESIGIPEFIDATLAFYDDNFHAHKVSEKGTRYNKNNLMKNASRNMVPIELEKFKNQNEVIDFMESRDMKQFTDEIGVFDIVMDPGR